MARKEKPVAAPGDEEFLEKEATPEEKKRGNFTRVTTLSYDEIEPSPD